MAGPTPPMEVLEEVRNLMAAKANDYQHPDSTVKHAHHYRHGIDTIQDMLHQKLLRAQSLIESDKPPKNESLEDTYKDIIAYASFAVCCVRGTLDGQDPKRDMFNRPRPRKGTTLIETLTGLTEAEHSAYDKLPSDVEPTTDDAAYFEKKANDLDERAAKARAQAALLRDAAVIYHEHRPAEPTMDGGDILAAWPKAATDVGRREIAAGAKEVLGCPVREDGSRIL